MDRYNLGYISPATLAMWMKENCGFTVHDEDLPAIQTYFDQNTDYRISREAFLTATMSPEDVIKEKANDWHGYYEQFDQKHDFVFHNF